MKTGILILLSFFMLFQLQAGKRKVVTWEQVLNKKITFSVQGLGLEEAIDKLASHTKLNFFVDPKVYEEHSDDELILSNINLKGVKFKHLLNIMLVDSLDLKYWIEGNVIMISTEMKRTAKKKVKLYDIRALLVKKKNYVPPKLALGKASESMDFNFAKGDEEDRSLTGEEIAELVQENISKEADQEVEVRFIPSGFLVVTYK